MISNHGNYDAILNLMKTLIIWPFFTRFYRMMAQNVGLKVYNQAEYVMSSPINSNDVTIYYYLELATRFTNFNEKRLLSICEIFQMPINLSILGRFTKIDHPYDRK